MNYIPGFSNYLETSLPRYADGGAIMGGAIMGDAAALTPEQRDARRIAANTRPQGTFLAAPTDNKGSATGFDIAGQQPNAFEYRGGPIRVTDRKGNVLFSGEGPEAALEAVKFAQNLSNTKGKKASWDIQQGERTINPDGSVGGLRWISGPSDAKEGMGVVGDLASFALPIAAAIATAGMSIPAQMAAAAAAGGIGGVMAGKDPLKQALLSGATAGIMGGSGANEAISGALGKVGGTIAGQTAGELGKQAAAEAGEQIVVTGLSKALQGAGSALGNTLLSEGVKGGLSGVTGYKTPAEKFAEQSATDNYAGLDPIVVTGGGTTLGDVAGGVISGLSPLDGLTPDPALTSTEQTYPDEEIVVTAPKAVTPEPVFPIGSVVAGLPLTGLPTADPKLTEGGKKLGVKDYIDIATLLAGLVPGASGGGSGGTIPAGMGALSSLFSKQLPTSTLPRGGALPASTLAAQGLNSPQNYYRYGYGPEQSFFDYATQGAPNTSRAYTGYEGSTAEDLFAAQPSRLPQPITTPIPNNPAGPSMYLPDMTRFAEGGYAVEGEGDGRDDKIPALLSDGEYVIDAETVAFLGNGSPKAGAKVLDEFRVKIRKHKGKKLARGEFSDNAKRPEQYLAGGQA